MQTDPIKTLVVEANVGIGEALIQNRLSEREAVEKGLSMLDNYLDQNELKKASLLKILSWDLNNLDENKVLDYQVEVYNIGYCRLPDFKFDINELPEFTLKECWATMSVPWDFFCGHFVVATCYYLSPAVLEHWKMRLSRDITWLISDLSSLTLTLENLEKNA